MRARIAILLTIVLIPGTGCRRAPQAASGAPPVCAGVGGLGGDAGAPAAVAADEALVFLGWRGAEHGQEIVAVDPAGRAQWSYHRGPGISGVTALAADAGIVFVLGGADGPDRDGAALYKLDARTGAPLPWTGRGEADLKITSLWPEDADTKPTLANALAAKNGRVYLTFTPHGFIAVLEAASGAYVTTLTAPDPAQMALSTTPMIDPDQPGKETVIDFGVCALARHGLACFIMNHDPAWVMQSTTRWLQPDEGIVAFAMRGDTMRTGEVTLYTALGAPQYQVQLRPAQAAEGFSVTVGELGGRAETGPWKADALRDIRAMAVDAAGQLWIAEGGEAPKRFSVWRTDVPKAVLVREIFGPLDADAPPVRVDPQDPDRFFAQGCEWRVDRASGTVRCVAVLGDQAARSR